MHATKPTWQSAGPEGLYLHTKSGAYYSRYRLNGTRTFRSLKTKVFAVAKLKHAKRQVDVERIASAVRNAAAICRYYRDLPKEVTTFVIAKRAVAIQLDCFGVTFLAMTVGI